MKKIIAFILSVVMLAIYATPVFAVEKPLAQTGNAQTMSPLEGSVCAYTLETEYGNIKMSEDGNYALEMSENAEYIPVGRMDIDILDDNEFNSAMQNSSLSEPVKHSLTIHREMLLSNGQQSYIATVFSPDLLARSIDISYPVYNGHRMRHEVIDYSNLQKQYTVSGPKSKDIADTLVTIALTGTGLSPVPAIALCSAGLSLFSFFISKYESALPVGGTNDYLTITIKYDKIDQFTCTDVLGEWMVGLSSQYVKIKEINTYQYYYDKTTQRGKDIDDTTYPNYEAETPHYRDPLPFAFQHMNDGVTEYITCIIHDKEFTF